MLLDCRRSDASLAETLHMRVESGARHVLGRDWRNCLMVAAGDEPFALVERAMAVAGRISGAQLQTPRAVPMRACSCGQLAASLGLEGKHGTNVAMTVRSRAGTRSRLNLRMFGRRLRCNCKFC